MTNVDARRKFDSHISERPSEDVSSKSRTKAKSQAEERQRQKKCDVIIVGAGLAGLSAARILASSGIQCIIVEARDRVGGRTLNYTLQAPGASAGTIVEVGGQWVGPTQNRALQLIKAMGLSTFKTWTRGKNVDVRNGVRSEYGGRIPKGALFGAIDVQIAMTRLNKMSKEVPLDKPWKALKANEWDSQTFQTWMENTMWTSAGHSLMLLLIEAIFSAQPKDISLLHVLFYIHSAGSFEILMETEGGAQDSRINGGSQLLAIALANEFGMDKILLNSPVEYIGHGEGIIKVRGSDFSIDAPRIIIAVPPTLAGRIRYDPPLDGLRDQLTQRVPMGTVIKVQCVYSSPFWRDQGLSGSSSNDLGPVKITFDNSPPDSSVGVLIGFLEGHDGRRLLRSSIEERKRTVIECFSRVFGEKATEPLEYVEYSWSDDQWSRGCYGGYFPPGVWTEYGEALREPIGHIYFAGTETAEEWMGYMEGAIQSGERAASEVKQSLQIHHN